MRSSCSPIPTGRGDIGVRSEGAGRARVAAVRQVSNVSKRVLAPRRRSATAMYKRMVETALADAAIDVTDRSAGIHRRGGLIAIPRAARDGRSAGAAARLARAPFVQARSKTPAAALPMELGVDSLRIVSVLVAQRQRWRKTLGSAAEDVLLDFLAKTQMLGFDLPVLSKDGSCAPRDAGRDSWGNRSSGSCGAVVPVGAVSARVYEREDYDFPCGSRGYTRRIDQRRVEPLTRNRSV